MKIAICSTGNELSSLIDMRFGRCNYFVFYDTESQSIEFLPNQNKTNDEDAGIASVRIIENRNAKKIICGEFGIKIKPMLDSLKIQMIVIKDSKKTISEVINLLKR